MEATDLDYYLLHGGLDQGFPLGISLMCGARIRAVIWGLGLEGLGNNREKKAGRERKDVPIKLKIPLVSLYNYLYTNAHS